MNPKNEFDFFHLKSCSSTQEEALARALKLQKEVVVMADEQLLGRGRRSRQWMSKLDRSLTFTLAIPREIVSLKNHLSLLAGAAVFSALSDCSKNFESLSIKWPNDLGMYKNNIFYKVAGILIELKQGYFLVGIGINLQDATNYPQALSLEDIDPNRSINRVKLCKKISELLIHHIKLPSSSDQLLEFLHNKPMSKLWNKQLGQNWCHHIAKGLAGDAALITIDNQQKRHLIYSGDI